MKERFKSILLELKTSLLNPNVKKELKNDEDKERHEKLLEFIDNYYKNIELFDKEEEHVQKLLLKNAEELLSNTSATYFNNYYPQYLRNTLFILNNYYKNKNNTTINNKENKQINEIKTTLSNDNILINLEKLKNIDLANYKDNLNKLKETDLNKLNEDINKLKKYNLQELYNNLKNKKDVLAPNIYQALEKIQSLDLEDYQNKLSQIKNMNFDKELTNVENVQKIKNDGFNIGNGSLIGEEIVIGNNNLIDEPIIIHKNNIPNFSSDIPSNENNDSLNTESDINAFAKLIAYKELKPPLAIGLFGKWGSGKSTFMDNLENRIKELSEEKNTKKVFHEKIAHIKFNAWHYSDSNLWANLMIQIFEKLNEFLKLKEIDKVEGHYLQLESTKEFLKEKEKEKIAIQDKIVQNKQKLENKINDKIKKTFKLNQLKDITKLVFEDEYIKSEFNQIREDFPFLKEKDINSIYKLYDDFNNNYGILKKFFSLLFKEKLFRKYLLGLFLVLILVFGLYFYIEDIKFVLSPLLILLPIGYKYLNKFKKVTSKISNFIEFYERKKSENEKNELELNLLKEQAALESELIILEETISLENKRLEEISLEIEHIKSGKYLADFIMERVNSSDYKQHLGLISFIRNDLEKLNEYLKQPEESAEYKIDRIVLYIDDLDRCSEDKIMDVLEAIHLLLALDLFVVIVGVDTRWIKKSLENKRSLAKKNNKNIATSKEYLEKIFQIPFHLQNMEEDVKKKQLEYLMENDLINTNKKINDDPNENNIEENSNIDLIALKENSSFSNNETSQDNSHKELKIEQFEYDYILRNAKNLGETPRSIKRFINIYRIIRSHEYILNELLEEFEEQYKFIIMILCLNNKNDNLVVGDCSEKLKELGFDSTDINAFGEFEKKDKLFKFISRFSFRDCK